MEPEEALHFHILRRRKEGVEDWIDRSVEKIGAVPTLNEVLLPAMSEVGDKFGAGELILPFVLQSAEVMKRAVAQLEHYLDKLEGYTKGTVVLATVFGDVHDIGKSLVNTILTNNGYTVVDLGKQVPISDDPRGGRRARRDGDRAVRAARLDLQADAGLRAGAARARAAVPGARRRRGDQPRLRPAHPLPDGGESDEVYEPGVFYCKDAFEGLAKMDALIDTAARRSWSPARARPHGAARAARGARRGAAPSTDDASVRQRREQGPCPVPPFWGVREIAVDMDEVYRHIDTHVLFKLHWGGRGVKGEAWRALVSEDFQPRLERMWRTQDYLHPSALLGYFPCNADGNELIMLDPQDPGRELSAWCSRASRGTTASAWPTSTAPATAASRRRRDPGGHRRDRGDRADGALEDGASSPSSCSCTASGCRCAEATAEWLHARVRSDLAIGAQQGRRYSWGYPACPEQSEHEKVFELLDASRSGCGCRRLRGRARAVDARDRRPPSAGGLLRDEVGLPAEDPAPGRRRCDRRQATGTRQKPRRAELSGRRPGRRASRARVRRRSAPARDQRELLLARQALDPRLLAPRGVRVAHAQRAGELNRQARAGVASATARGVGREAALEVDRPARVQRAVGAAQDVDPGVHGTIFAATPARPAARMW